MGDVHASFTPAAQPDIIRAAEKDDFYRQARGVSRQALRSSALSSVRPPQVVEERLQDVSRCFLGPRRAVALHDEARAARAALRRVGRSAEAAPRVVRRPRRFHCSRPCCITR